MFNKQDINEQFTVSTGRTYICVYDKVTNVPVLEIRTFPHIQVQHRGVFNDENIGEIPLNHLYFRMYIHERVKKSLANLTYTIED